MHYHLNFSLLIKLVRAISLSLSLRFGEYSPGQRQLASRFLPKSATLSVDRSLGSLSFGQENVRRRQSRGPLHHL